MAQNSLRLVEESSVDKSKALDAALSQIEAAGSLQEVAELDARLLGKQGQLAGFKRQLGALATMTGILLPSTALSIYASRWGAARRETRAVRAFTTGLTPLTIGLLCSEVFTFDGLLFTQSSKLRGAGNS